MRFGLLTLFAVVLGGCATTAANRQVDLKQPRRLLGTENGVRIDAEVWTEELGPASSIPLHYDITNERSEQIAIAELVPDSSYDADSGTVTISIGAEVPGQEFLPRLMTIAAGEKKTFTTVARVNLASAASGLTPRSRVPNSLAVKVNFLADARPFAQLIGIPERAVRDQGLATQLFSKWLELNEVVLTNSLPMRWAPQDGGKTAGEAAVPDRTGSRRH